LFSLTLASVEIAQGNVDATLNLVWLIVMHSDLKRFLPEKPVETSLTAMTANCAAQLTEWLKRRLADYKNVPVADLAGTFRNGLALAALTHFMRPDSLPYMQLTAANVSQNLMLGIQKALQFCNIPALMDADDFMAAGGPDEAALMTYLAEYLKYYRQKWGRKGFMPAHMRYALPAGGAVAGGGSGGSGGGGGKDRRALPANWEINYKDLRIEKEIGRGAFGQVFIGQWRMSRVAVKQLLLRQDKMTDEQMAEFMGECELMMRLRPHKNVVLLLGVVIDPAQPLCLVTDYQANGSLHSLLKSDRAIGWEMTLRILEGVAAGMYHIHEEKILHRDLAARNVLLSESMDAMVADFGLSAQTTAGETQETVFRGALKYMAPESLRHNMFSTKSDVWSYGVLVWEVLTRAAPFADLQLQDAAQKIKKGLRLPMPVDCPAPLELILEQCWCQEPESRPSFDQFVAHFAKIRRECAAYASLPLLLPGEQARKQRASASIAAAATSLPTGPESQAQDSPTSRRSVDSGVLARQRDSAAADVVARRQLQTSSGSSEPRRTSGGGGSSGSRLVETGGDVSAAAAAAAANYAATQSSPLRAESPAASLPVARQTGRAPGPVAITVLSPDESGYGVASAVHPENGGAGAEYGVGPAERVESPPVGSRRVLSPRVAPNLDAVVVVDSDSAEHSESSASGAAPADDPPEDEDGGNQYDALPTELDSKRRATIESAIASVETSTLVGVTSLTMQLPPRPTQRLIGMQRSKEVSKGKGAAATLAALPSLSTILDAGPAAATKKPKTPAPTPAPAPTAPESEYALAPAPVESEGAKEGKSKKKTKKATPQPVEADGEYGLAPPPASAEYGLAPPERESSGSSSSSKKKEKESSDGKKTKKKSKE
jgi:serine/threonine protein kinase